MNQIPDIKTIFNAKLTDIDGDGNYYMELENVPILHGDFLPEEVLHQKLIGKNN